MHQFDHEKLEVYKVSLLFATLANEVASTLAAKRTTLSDQLSRAAFSITLNIAEGAGELRPKEKARFYRMAARSGTECAAIFDVCMAISVIDEARQIAGKELLVRIVSRLIRLEQSLRKRAERHGEQERGEGSGTGTGRGTGTGTEAMRKPR